MRLMTTAVVLTTGFGIFFAKAYQGFGKKEFPDQISHCQGQYQIGQYVLKKFHSIQNLKSGKCYKISKNAHKE